MLSEAKHTIDSSSSLHFTLTSQGAAGSGTLITGGKGDAKRPAGFTGTLTVMRSGLTVTVDIVSVQGGFWVRLPLTTTFERTDPSSYGFGDPAQLLDPNTGLSSLLTQAITASMQDRDRLQGEELYEVAVTLPGQRVASLLTSADPSKPVHGVVGVDVDNHQVRRVVLTGPFFQKGVDSTYTLILDNYGENVTVTPPAA